MSTVNIMYDGRSQEIPLEDLFPLHRRGNMGLPEGTLSSDSLTAGQIKQALANHFDKPMDEFNELVVDHHKNGNISVRPNAVFGNKGH